MFRRIGEYLDLQLALMFSSIGKFSDKRRLCCLVAAITGALGVSSGYAVFFLYMENAEKNSWTKFLVALTVAAAVGALTEWLRDLIKHGTEESDDQSPIVRVIGTIAVVGLFELFIESFHASAEMGREAFYRAAEIVLGESVKGGGWTWDIVATAGVWVFVGAMLSLLLSLSIPGEGEARGGMVRSAKFGGFAGIVGAPLALLTYVLAARTITAIPYTAANYRGWVAVVTWFSQLRFVPTHGIFTWLFAPTGLLSLLSDNAWEFLGGAIVLTAIMVAVMEDGEASLPQLVVGLGWVIAVVFPFFGGLGFTLWELFKWEPLKQLAELLLLAALIWGVPGLLLGCLAPWLRVPSSRYRWALVGYMSAFLLVAARLFTGNQDLWPFALAIVAIISGVLFHRGFSVVDYWPFAALSVAIGIGGAMSLVEFATFAGEVGRVHALNEITPRPFAELPVLQSFKPPPSPTVSEFDKAVEELRIGNMNKTPYKTAPTEKNVQKAKVVPPETGTGDEHKKEAEAAARVLEVAITASVGFWTTVGLLACWRILGARTEE